MLSLTQHKIVGLTGMSGAGKSTVSRLFDKDGWCVIDCDRVAREVVKAGSPFLSELAANFSDKLINPDGTLNRAETAKLIFTDPQKRIQYNKIIYPYIAYNIMSEIRRAENDILLDAPTLFEARLDGICTDIVSVCADKEKCAERIVKRDGISMEMAKARLSSQHDVSFFRERSSYCIENNGTSEELSAAASEVLKQLKGNR